MHLGNSLQSESRTPTCTYLHQVGGGKDQSVVMIQDEYLLSVHNQPSAVRGKKTLRVKFPAVSPAAAATEGFSLNYRFRTFKKTLFSMA